MKNKKFFKFGSFVLALLLSANYVGHEVSVNRQINNVIGEHLTSADRYIGYGYNVNRGKTISDIDSLCMNNPILDLSSEKVANAVKIFDGSTTDYRNEVDAKKSGIAEKYALHMGAGLKGKIPQVFMDFESKFDMSYGVGWSKTQKEEFSFYNIVAKNKTVTLQLDKYDIKECLNPKFEKDLLSVNSIEKAKDLMNRYGTHLLTGYILGGLMEMTNYFATTRSTYDKSGTASFDQQIKAAIGSMNGEAGFSFDAEFGSKHNNSEAINKYKLKTYGGRTFTGLTIDQAFRFDNNFVNGKYIYQLWTDSINEDDGTVIVDIPSNSEMIPLYDLLPASQEYAVARQNLLDAYIEMCKTQYDTFAIKYPNCYPNDLRNEPYKVEDPGLQEKGYSYYTNVDPHNPNSDYFSTYVDTTTKDPNINSEIASGSTIALDFNYGAYNGLELEWIIPNANDRDYVSILDSRNGVFKVSPTCPEMTFKVVAQLNGKEVYSKLFNVLTGAYSGGDGSENNPFIITNEQQFMNFMTDTPNLTTSKHFALVNDLDLKGKGIAPICSRNTPFNGVFDGGYHTIKNFNIKATDSQEYTGLFGGNSGTIKNVTLDSDSKIQYINYLGENIKNNDLTFDQETKCYVKGMGTVAGYNDKKGIIENVTVRNAELLLNNNINNLDAYDTLNHGVGGIAGFNQGKIDRCTFDQGVIFANSRKGKDMRVGGIAGSNHGDIFGSTVIKPSILSSIGERLSDHAHQAFNYTGGIAGKNFAGANIDNCLIKGVTAPFVDVPCPDENRSTRTKIPAIGENNIFATAFGEDSGFSGEAGTLRDIYAGGVTGRNEKGAKINNVIVDNVSSVRSELDSLWNPWAGRCGQGTVVGRLEEVKDLTNVVAKNAQLVPGYTEADFYDYPSMENYIPKTNSDITGVTKVTSVEYANLNSSFKNASEYWMDNSNYPIIKIRDIDVSTIRLSHTPSKTTYFVGEAFVPSDIRIDARIKNAKEAVTINTYTIDSSGFDSSSPKTCTIKVNTYGVTLTYDVEIVAPQTKTVFIQAEENPVDRFENQKFNAKEELQVIEILENGERRTVPSNELESTPVTLEAGVNYVSINYKGFGLKYIVNAKELEIEKVTIISKPNTLEYNIGVSEIDLTGLEVEITYKNGSTKIVNGKDCDLIYSSVALGTNVVTVSYGPYIFDTFEITGIAHYDMNKINEFVNLVNSIKVEPSMRIKFNTIKKARNLLDTIGECYDDSFTKAKQDLFTEMDNYNGEVIKTNNDFADAITISSTLSYSAYESTQFTMVIALLMFIRKSLVL